MKIHTVKSQDVNKKELSRVILICAPEFEWSIWLILEDHCVPCMIQTVFVTLK